MTRVEHEPRIVVVGYGRWGRCCHCYLVSQTPGLILHGVVSSDSEKRDAIKREHGCRTYAMLTEALADPDVDGVILATPNSAHADQAIAALTAGKHVITDKVMCLTLADCDRMIEAARASDRLLTVFQNRRLDGDFLTIKALMARGALGDVRWFEAAWQGFGLWGRWRGEARMGGGKIYDLGPHLVDQILQLFPEAVQSVYCRTHYDLPGADVESEGLLVITFEGGRTAVVDVSSLALVQKPRFYIRGTEATFIKHGLDPQEKAMMDGDIDAAVEAPELYGMLHTTNGKEAIPTLPGRWRTYFDNLRDTLRGNAAPLVSVTDARRVMEVIDAAKRSAREDNVVTLQPDGSR